MRAAFIGALTSLLIPVSFIVFFVLGEIFYPPENSENDGYIRGFAIFLGFVPLIFFSCFIYFILMSIKETLSLKSALIVSLLLSCSLGFLLTKNSAPMPQLFIYWGSVSLFFSTTLCLGAWVWHKKLKT
ncbi:hypothetical protein Marme_1662 [Marinomonas mediterranea MMB-1]|jgi:hypothetical protein|uniref:Uncharacterized protein n=2 Tax=Marinomonas mediterranea TaxID=119864 RepID=F2JZR9_MARM1|nr:hypothetical protein Marme_1662 [Marinomonas mediterranea MMB-1]